MTDAERERLDPGFRSTSSETAFAGDPDFHAAGAPSASPTLDPAVLLCDRFRTVRFIARGGMSEVFEAEDIELREHVALKLLTPEICNDPHAMERFTREIHLARRVTHPAVCRAYDLFRHVGRDRVGAARSFRS